MTNLRDFYRTSNLAQYGRFIVLVLIVLLILGKLLIPEFKPEKSKEQLFEIRGVTTKYNDKIELKTFIESIKSNKGFLCLGTSESGNLEGKNYYDFLNRDPQISSSFSVLAGAGRNCGLYIPLILDQPEVFEGLKLIYFINPVYWRTDVCEVNEEYWSRYSNIAMCKYVELKSTNERELFKVVEEHYSLLNPFQKLKATMEYHIRESRKVFFRDLRHWVYPEEYNQQFNYVSKSKINKEVEVVHSDLIDTTINANYSFHNQEWFRPIDENSDYRFRELQAFIDACRIAKIKLQFVVGPYNQRFIKHYYPTDLKGYQNVVQKICALLDHEKTSYINAIDISTIAGAFIDHQHHSTYGAFLISKKLKQQLNEN
jgi:hypothetical protein